LINIFHLGEGSLLFKNQRLQEMLRIIRESQHATVPELAQRLFISEATVRRDIAILERNGLILKSYGGISLNTGNNRFVQLNLRAVANEQAKKRIAARAAALVEPGDTLLIDGSSTVMCMIPLLKQRNLTVITNSLRAAAQLGESGARVYVTGGLLLESSQVFVGSVAEAALNTFHADKLFFSATGVSAQGDISDYSEMEAHLRRIMLRRSAQQYLLCDSTKFEKQHLFHIANVESLTGVIADEAYRFQNGVSTLPANQKEASPHD